MGQRLSDRIISRRATGTAGWSCDLRTGSGSRAVRLASAPTFFVSVTTERATGTAFGGESHLSYPSTFVSMPSVLADHGILY